MTKPTKKTTDNRDRISVDLGGGLRSRIEKIWKNPFFNFQDFKFVPVVRVILIKGVEWFEQEAKRLATQASKPSIAELISSWDLSELSEQTDLSVAELSALMAGERPTDEQLIDLATVLTYNGEPLDTHQLMAIRSRDFNGTSNKEKHHAR